MAPVSMRAFLVLSQLLLFMGSGGPGAPTAWLNALLDRGLFSDACEAGEDEVPCAAQAYALSQATTLVLTMGPLMAWPAGLLTNVFHPATVMIGCIAIFLVTASLRGVMHDDGTFYLVAGVMTSMAHFSMVTILQGRVLPLCAKNEKERDVLVGQSVVTGLIGAAAAVPLVLYVKWGALPLWFSFGSIGFAVGISMLLLHRLVIEPNRDAFARRNMTLAELAHSTGQVLTNRWVLHGILWRSVVHGITRAVEASVNVIASKHFHTSPDAQTYSPFVAAIGGVIFLFFDRIGVDEFPRLVLALRMFWVQAMLVLWVLPQARNGLCFYLGLLAMLTYRAHVAVAMKRNTLAAFAKRKAVCGQAMGYLQTAASAVSIGVGTLATHLFHQGGPGALAWVVIAAAGGSILFELPLIYLVMQGRSIEDPTEGGPSSLVPKSMPKSAARMAARVDDGAHAALLDQEMARQRAA
jgi:hypothetical protein